MSSAVAEEPPPPPHPAATSATAPEHEAAHQYVRSIGCHFVTVTGFQPSLGAPFSIVTSVCRMKFSSSRSGKSYGRAWAPRLSLRSIPATTMQEARSSRKPSSSACVRSLLKTSPLSSTTTRS